MRPLSQLVLAFSLSCGFLNAAPIDDAFLSNQEKPFNGCQRVHAEVSAMTASFKNLIIEAFGDGFFARITNPKKVNNKSVELEVSDVLTLFDAIQDPWVQRMSRFIIQRVRRNTLQITLKSDAEDLDYASGTCWSSGGCHQIDILIDPEYIGTKNLGKYGIKAIIRSVLVHEAMHARIYEYCIKWLKDRGLSSYWQRKLSSATEEYMARLAEQYALGNSGPSAKFKAWFATVVDADAGFSVWKPLEDVWRDKLRKENIKVKE